MRLLAFLTEIGLKPTAAYDRNYGNVARLDEDTRTLCEWCRHNDMSSRSLELQIWWRDHQRADAAKAEADDAQRAAELAKKSALSKLTPEEIRALGIR